MGFTAPTRGNRLRILSADNSCWRIMRVDRSFIMVSKIRVGVRLSIGSAARFNAWINFALRSPPRR
jgi:hypothetical protein